MLKNYLKSALRNLAKQKGLAFINIFGLSVGIACFSLFLLYAINEFSFDQFHKNGKNIYRVYLWINGIGDQTSHGMSYHPMPLGPAMQRELPGIENYVRLREAWSESFIKADDKVLREKVSYADPTFFSVFSFRLIHGNPATALRDLHSIVLTASVAKKIYGNANPMGKSLLIKTEDNFVPFTVTGIAEDPPAFSTIGFNMLANFNYLATINYGAKAINNWHRFSYQTYVQLKPGSNLLTDPQLLATFRKKYYPDEEKNARKEGWKGKGAKNYFGLQPIRFMHTDMSIGGGIVEVIDPKKIWLLLGIAAGVLLIACINFTTLAIGRSAGRSKEVGVRKVIGGTKKMLVSQFLTESLLMTIFSAGFGLILARLALPFFNRLSERNITMSFALYPEMILLLIALVLIVGLFAGAYPALVLSAFRPIEVLKTKIRVGGSNLFTKSLVTFQFILSAGLIISTIIIMEQVHFMRSTHPGFNKENVVVADAFGISDTKKLYSLLKQELSVQPEILGTASAELSLGEGTGWNQSMFKYNGRNREVYEYFVDPDYIHVLGLKLLAGRNFDPAIHADTVTSVIINEAMMNDFGWTFNNAVGQKLNGYFDDEHDSRTPVVIGVVNNFNYSSLGSKIEPQLFQQFSSYLPFHFFIRLRPGNPDKALASIQTTWKKVAPDYPLKYSFLDDDLNRFYKSEVRWSNIIGWAGGISIFLAILGLFGLSALAAINRTKEIGIRKVLGASLLTIIQLLSKDFLRLVSIALLIATPLVWFFMNKWLQDYPYRIHITGWVFFLTGLATLIISLVTISFQVIKAARTQPVNSLRSE